MQTILKLHTGGDLYEDLRRRGGKYEEVVTAAGVLKPCIEALMYLHSKVGVCSVCIRSGHIMLLPPCQCTLLLVYMAAATLWLVGIPGKSC